MICNECDGRGYNPKTEDLEKNELQWVCPKCQGDGWVDWISNITGKPFIEEPPDYLNKWAGLAAKELAKKIDQDIMDTLMKKSAHA